MTFKIYFSWNFKEYFPVYAKAPKAQNIRLVNFLYRTKESLCVLE